MENIYFYKMEKIKKNILVELYIHKIGFYRFNWHKPIELILIMKGSVEVCIEGKRYNLREDDLILINSNSGHATLAQEPGSKAMVLHIDPIYFEEYVKEYKHFKFNSANFPNKNSAEAKELRQLLIFLMESLGKNDITNQIYSESYLAMISAKLIEIFAPIKNETDYHSKNQNHRETIYKILNYMENNFIDPISLEDVAELTGYNTNYLSQYFKKNIGINFQDYLTRIRLREATIELSTTNLMIGDIAIKNGFSNIKSFNTCFKKTFGRVPSEYRKKLEIDKDYKKILTKRDFVKLDNKIIKRKISEYKNTTLITAQSDKKQEISNKIAQRNEIDNLKKLINLSEERNAKMLELIEKSKNEIDKLKENLN